MPRSLLLSLALCLSTQTVSATKPVSEEPASVEPASEEPASEKQVDAVFAEWNRKDSPGCAVTVVDDGRQVYRKGFGMASLELDVPITPQTVFYIASTSKQFTAAAIALLVEQGRLSLDDDIRRYVPELPRYPRTITVSQLIHHTSGLRDYLELSELAGRSSADRFPQQLALRMIARQQATNFTPGSEHGYSNTNYFLLSVIVERVSGQTLRAFSDTHLFKPLGMRHTQFYDDPERIVPGRTIGHTGNAQQGWRLFRTNYALVGDGGLLTTVDDLAQWERNFLDNQLGKNKKEFIRRLTTPGKLDNGEVTDYAFGLNIGQYRGLPTVSHGGSFLAYNADMLRFPEQRLGIYVLCNADAADPHEMSLAIADLYLAHAFTEPAPMSGASDEESSDESKDDEEQNSARAISAQQRAQLAGRYYSAELDALYTLSASENGINVQVADNPVDTYEIQGPDRIGDDYRTARFSRDASGKIDGFVLDAGRVQGLRFERRP